MSRPLTSALRAEGGILAELAGSSPDSAEAPAAAQKAASGPRTADRRDEYELLLEMIIEGSRLHYGGSSVVSAEDPDLALLVGDQLYALGLARLAALGDMEAVSILAETIASLAQAHAEGDSERGEQIWDGAALRIGWDRGDGCDGRHTPPSVS
jgi:hypothetical protein